MKKVKTIKSLFHHCLEVIEENGWYLPVRFTKAQLKTYSETEQFAVRSMAPSSVCLAFRTQAKKVKIQYSISAKARNWAVFDMLVDGCLLHSAEATQDEGVVEFSLSGNGEEKIEIFLPHLVDIKIKAPIADAPLLPIQKKKKLMLALGDSITQGMVARHPSFAYPVTVARHLNYDLLNCGVGSIYFNEKELDFIGKEPHLITIALGCNDWYLFNVSQIEEQATAYLKKLFSLYSCRNVYGILPIWTSACNKTQNGATFEECRKTIQTVYERYPFIKIIDGYKLVPQSTEFFNDPEDVQTHPSDEGFLYYGLQLLRHIK